MSFARVSFFIGPELIARASTFSPKTRELIREISEKRRGISRIEDSNTSVRKEI